MEIYLQSPAGEEINLTASGASSRRLVNNYPAGLFDTAPVEHIQRVDIDGNLYLHQYRYRPRVIDLKLVAIGVSVTALWSEINTILSKARMSSTPCRLKVVEGSKTAYLDIYPESSMVFLNVLSGELTLRVVSYGKWYSETQRTETLSARVSGNYSYIAARTKGSGWSSMGGANNYVYAFALAPDGTLYAGGIFTQIGGVSANRIAKWNGSAWSALGSGMNGNVNTLVVAPDGTLYAGGIFTTAGGVAANNIAKWDGTNWSALGSGTSSTVRALAITPNGTLYVGGSFTTAGGITVNYIAKWDGTSWSALGSGMNGDVNTLAVAPDGTLYAGGNFTTAGGITVNHIAKWDGTNWSALGGGMNTLPPYLRSVWAITIAQDGTLYAGGRFETAGGVTAKNIAKWDGSAWSALGSGMNDRVTGLSIEQNVLYASGWFSASGDTVFLDRVAIWNGYRWLPLDIDLPGGAIAYGLLARNGNVYLGYDKTGTVYHASVNVITGVVSEVYPKLVITASTAATVQYLENETTGQRVWINYNLLPGETLTLDFDKATAVSSSWGNVLRSIVPGSNMRFKLIPGTNKIWFFAPTGTVTAQLIWYPQFATLAEALQ